MAYPRTIITPELQQKVEDLAATGAPPEDITILTGIPLRTLTSRYKKQIAFGHAKFRQTLRESQVKLADKAALATIFMGKQALGQEDKKPAQKSRFSAMEPEAQSSAFDRTAQKLIGKKSKRQTEDKTEHKILFYNPSKAS